MEENVCEKDCQCEEKNSCEKECHCEHEKKEKYTDLRYCIRGTLLHSVSLICTFESLPVREQAGTGGRRMESVLPVSGGTEQKAEKRGISALQLEAGFGE